MPLPGLIRGQSARPGKRTLRTTSLWEEMKPDFSLVGIGKKQPTP